MTILLVTELNILLVDNNFSGAYGSISVFLDEIEYCLQKDNTVFRTASTEESKRICMQNGIDFSIGIGKYNQFENGIPLYEVLRIHHYQWIIDNPLKLDIDYHGRYVKYIFIDKEFADVIPNVEHTPLQLPLGVCVSDTAHKEKNRGVTFCGQIKDMNSIFRDINASALKLEVSRLIEIIASNLDKSFIRQFVDSIEPFEHEKKRAIFRLVNSYIRAYKRKLVLSRISNYPLIIIGDIQDREVLAQRNVIYLGKRTYSETQKLLEEYEYSLNIEPNYKYCLHDRILRSINAGSCVITDRSELCESIFGEAIVYFDYTKADALEERLLGMDSALREKKVRAAKQMLNDYSWTAVLAAVINDFRILKEMGV